MTPTLRAGNSLPRWHSFRESARPQATMPAYTYRAVTATGNRVRGIAECESQRELATRLEEGGLFLLSAESRAERPAPLRGPFARRRTTQQLLEATRTIAALQSAGLPLRRCLTSAQTAAGGDVGAALGAIQGRIDRGDTLASGLAAYPTLFPVMYVGLVRAGERSGDLSAAFARLTVELEREQQLRARIMSAMLYPMILGLAGAVSLCILLFVVLPRFASILADSGTTLPRSSAAMMQVATFLDRNWLAVLVTTGVGIAFTTVVALSAAGRQWIAGAVLHIPIVGRLRRVMLAGRFSRLTGVMMSSGVPLLTALEAAGNAIGDATAQREILRLHDRVREGSSLAACLRDSQLFPTLLTQLAAVGEEASRLSDFLLKAADLFDDRAERIRQRIVTMAEPTMIVVFGGMIGFVALALLQGVYSVDAGVAR